MPRVFAEFVGGVLSADATAGSTSISSGALAQLQVVDSAEDEWVDITIDPDGLLGSPESNRITNHVATATSATVDALLGDYKAGTRWVATLSKAALDEGIGGGGVAGDVHQVRFATTASPQPYIDVADYLVDGTWDTNDHTAKLQAAIDAVPADIDSIAVVLGPGEYFFNGVTIPTTMKRVLIRAEESTVTGADGADIHRPVTISTSGPNPFFTASHGDVSYTFERLYLDAGAYGQTYTSPSTMYSSTTLYVTFGFRDCEIAFWNGADVPLIDGKCDLVMERCMLWGEPEYGSNMPVIRLNNQYLQGYVSDCFIESYSWGGTGIPGTETVFELSSGNATWDANDLYAAFTIRNCLLNGRSQLIRAFDTNSISISDNSVSGWVNTTTGSGSKVATFERCSNIRMTNNVAFDSDLVEMIDCRDMRVAENAVKGLTTPIRVTDTIDSYIESNTITDTPAGEIAIELDGTSSDNMIINNMIRARTVNPAAAIQVTDATCENNVVQGNSLGRTFDTATPLTFVDNGTGTIT